MWPELDRLDSRNRAMLLQAKSSNEKDLISLAGSGHVPLDYSQDGTADFHKQASRTLLLPGKVKMVNLKDNQDESIITEMRDDVIANSKKSNGPPEARN